MIQGDEVTQAENAAEAFNTLCNPRSNVGQRAVAEGHVKALEYMNAVELLKTNTQLAAATSELIEVERQNHIETARMATATDHLAHETARMAKATIALAVLTFCLCIVTAVVAIV